MNRPRPLHLTPIAAVLAVLAVLLTVLPVAAGEAEHAFVGTKNCKKCHLKEYKSWAETKMAMSFDNLKPGVRAEAKTAAGLDPAKDYTKDATCLPCHTTGYGKKGGFVDIETTPELAGVSCEACHGAGEDYIQEQLMSLKNKEYKLADVVAAGMVAEVSAEQCVQCHNSKSPFVDEGFVFDFAANKDKGTHEAFPLKYEH
jgi:Cytochrome c554 and c-prime